MSRLDPQWDRGDPRWDRGHWFVTYSGRAMNVEDPIAWDIRLIDIAHHLARICRFGGAVKTFYSVADHSVYVSRLLPPDRRVAGLLHDATEAYLGDVIAPLKACLPEYKRIEARWQSAIESRFQLDRGSLGAAIVKRADLMALGAERRDLMPQTMRPHGPSEVWKAYNARFGDIPAAGDPCVPSKSPSEAQQTFLEYAKELGL